MRTAKRVLVAFAAILAVLLAVGFLLPRTMHVERSTVIDAPAEVVFAEVNDLRRWETWTPWGKDRDPSVELKYSESAVGKGAWFTWTSEELGSGKLEISDAVVAKSIAMRLHFDGGMSGPANCGFKFEPTSFKGDARRVTVIWYCDADMGVWPPGRYFGLFMDKILGSDYERGLANLKQVAERQAGSAN
jgi:hypothetical protein